jgi:hypothetical protein
MGHPELGAGGAERAQRCEHRAVFLLMMWSRKTQQKKQIPCGNDRKKNKGQKEEQRLMSKEMIRKRGADICAPSCFVWSVRSLFDLPFV